MKKVLMYSGGKGKTSVSEGASRSATLTSQVQSDAQYLSTLIQQALDAQMSFVNNPSASTAIEYALSYGHYLDHHVEGSNSIDTYPLMIFTNPEKHTYMIYSNTIRDWFTIEHDGHETIIHDLSTFGSYGKAGVFQFISDGSSYLFDATFKAPVITNIGEETFQSSPKYDAHQYSPQLGISIFH